jgi:LuxR family maltose regulon positive regulatory protein
MQSNLLLTKILIPPVRPIWVPRPHLIAQLNAGLDQKLILVSAPAGYGKSTLLNEWAHQAPMPVAWLSLEKGDNTPSRFWAYFAAALQTIPRLHDAHVGENLLELERVSWPLSLEDTLTSLVAEISGVPDRFVLVLDDLHLITESKIHEGLTFLLEHLPPPPGGMHLVISSRMDPPWPLARMRARAETTEIRTRDLRFNPDETTVFLNKLMGLKLSANDVTRLEQRTEGWIAGLQMAALSMQKREDIPAFLDRFSGSHRYVLDYLIEEVLSQQTPEVLDFLLKTSILDRLTAPLCDAVTGGKGSQDILAQLERSNVFLFSLDDEQSWYRYHPLFSDLLRKRLSISHAAQIPDLHIRASEWYEANGFLQDAILHALDADDMKQVARLVSGNILLLTEGQALAELLDHIHSLPPEDIHSRPRLCVSVAWVKAYAGQLNDAEALINDMETTLAGTASESERAHLTGHGMAIRAYAQWIKGHADQAIDISREALARIPAEDTLAKANILITLGLALQRQRDISGAIQAFRDSIAISRESGNHYLLIYASSCLAFVLLIAGSCVSPLRSVRKPSRSLSRTKRQAADYSY